MSTNDLVPDDYEAALQVSADMLVEEAARRVVAERKLLEARQRIASKGKQILGRLGEGGLNLYGAGGQLAATAAEARAAAQAAALTAGFNGAWSAELVNAVEQLLASTVLLVDVPSNASESAMKRVLEAARLGVWSRGVRDVLV